MSELNDRTPNWYLESWRIGWCEKTPPHLVLEVKCGCVSIGSSISLLTGVIGVGFARTALACGSVWFGKRKDERVGSKDPLNPGWPQGHLWYGIAAVLQSFTQK